MNIEYPIQIIWSDEDQAYIATALGLAGCLADGETPESAMQNLKVIIGEWVETAQDQNRPIPVPFSAQTMAKFQLELLQVQQQRLQEFIQMQVSQLVKEKHVLEIFQENFPQQYAATILTHSRQTFGVEKHERKHEHKHERSGHVHA
jgi:predicted RNase H-like HicB family nuclease